jgi:hypothetical protein
MLESKFTGKLLKALRRHPRLAGAVIWKHNDWSTAGIPDFSITHNQQTTWFEVKIFPNTPTKLQRHYLNLLGLSAFVITYGGDNAVGFERVNGYYTEMTFKELVEQIARVS